MTMNDLTSIRGMIVAAAVLACGGGGFYWYHHGATEASLLPKDLRYENLKAQASTDPTKLGETMRENMRRDDLTDEQRQELRQNMRKVFTEMLDERVDEYYKSTPEEQSVVLDKHIDEFQERMKEWEQRRKEWEAEREKREKEGKEGEGNEPRGSGWRGPQSQEERKAESESQNPDQMGRRMAYFMAIQQRATERGIKLPMMGGRGIGPGGGPRRQGP